MNTATILWTDWNLHFLPICLFWILLHKDKFNRIRLLLMNKQQKILQYCWNTVRCCSILLKQRFLTVGLLHKRGFSHTFQFFPGASPMCVWQNIWYASISVNTGAYTRVYFYTFTHRISVIVYWWLNHAKHRQPLQQFCTWTHRMWSLKLLLLCWHVFWSVANINKFTLLCSNTFLRFTDLLYKPFCSRVLNRSTALSTLTW